VREGRFREDLYYRLRVVELVVPSLADRREDIPLLIQRFLTDTVERFQRPLKPLSGEALRACMHHPWKGNIRELKSAVEKALLLAAGDEIEADDLFGRPAVPSPSRKLDASLPKSFRDAKQRVVEDFEKEFLAAALARNGGNISRTAEEVGMYRQNLQQKIRELGLEALSVIDIAEADVAKARQDKRRAGVSVSDDDDVVEQE
jgi:DNA-binding NtrC family response regulator